MTNQPADIRPRRHLPVRPDLTQLRHQAKDLLREANRGSEPVLAEFAALGAKLKLSDAQLVLARSYGAPSWTRLVQACEVAEAIWNNDPDALKTLLLKRPQLLQEPVRIEQDNWGAPMSYASTLGRTQIVEMLAQLGAADLQHAFRRACLKGQLESARRLVAMGARVEPGMVMDPCETLNGQGLAFLLDLGADFADEKGDRLAPVGQILQTYTRNPEGKRRCLELAVQKGIELPDTPAMALHRGRRDLLEDHLRRDRQLFTRQFSHGEIYPLELGCSPDPSYALHGTPLAGGTLLHMAVDYDEGALLEWMLDQGAPPDAPAAADEEGFGGHTALFGTVVNQPYRAGRPGSDVLARHLLSRGASRTVRASLRKALRFVADESLHEYRDVTPREWGERFHDQDWVNPSALALV